jgi:hypothetical protein
MTSNVFELLEVPVIDDYKNYWLVRSNEGKFFDDFNLHSYIAISWDFISLDTYKNNDEEALRRIIEMSIRSSRDISEEDDDDDSDDSTENRGQKGKTTNILNKLRRFIDEMQIGDIVLVPSHSSGKILLGFIDGDVYEDSTYIENNLRDNELSEMDLCPFHKRRSVRWEKTMPRHQMDMYLAKAFSSQHALSNLNEYASLIDRAIHPLYLKNNEVHATFMAGPPEGMTISTLIGFLDNLDKSIKGVGNQFGAVIHDSDLQIKLNIHSLGLLEIAALTVSGGAALAIVMVAINHFINGSRFKLSFKTKGKDESGIEFSLESESKGLKGMALENKKLDMERNIIEIPNEQALIDAAREIDIQSPDEDE